MLNNKDLYSLWEFYCWSNKSCIDASLTCNNQLDCPNGEDETICEAQLCPKNTFRCSSGRCIDEKSLCDSFNDCINGDDESDVLCKAINCYGPDCETVNCSPIKSNRINVSCTYNNKAASCEHDIKPGTVAKYFCKEYYQPNTNIHKFNNEAICQKNGEWSSEILKCTPKCGYLKDPVPLIVNGFQPDFILPWHATIFIKRESRFEFACGASLVSESVIASASHCFTGLNESDVKIAIGKQYSNITVQLDEPNAKVFTVLRIFRHPLYLDKIGNYGQDIALVELNETVQLNDDIHPICLDWDNDDYLAPNQLGIVVGMGVTENDTFSDTIRMARLQVISTENCISKQPKDFRKYITFTTFCAGLENGNLFFFFFSLFIV